jgi:hypothetical protein
MKANNIIKILENTCAARLPLAGLVALADLRGTGGITVIIRGELAWVRWEPAHERVLRRLMVVPGAVLYDLRDGVWYPHGRRLPAFGVPLEMGEAVGLERAITPLPIEPRWPSESASGPVRLRLVRDDRPRPAAALRCRLGDLTDWVETATTVRLSAVLAAREGEHMMMLGRTLPTIAAGIRFWGDAVLVPLGFRTDPVLPESAVRGSLGLEEDELLVIDEHGCEVVPREAFRPLTRGAFRLALAEGGG